MMRCPSAIHALCFASVVAVAGSVACNSSVECSACTVSNVATASSTGGDDDPVAPPQVTDTDPTSPADPAPAAPVVPRLTGLNFASGSFGGSPGTYATTYIYAPDSDTDHFAGLGMNTVRFAFHWENLQASAKADLDVTELGRIDAFISHATGAGVYTLLDPHNYNYYFGKQVGVDIDASVLADLWSKLATHYKDNDHVVFGLMNEPNALTDVQWLPVANASIAAIRATGATNLITVPGVFWTGAHAWTTASAAMSGVVDSGNNFIFEMHQYLDSDYSGTHDTCASATIGSETLADATTWLKQHNARAILGEFASGRDDTCMAALTDMLTFMDTNNDAWVGWTYFAGGPWWPSTNTMMIEPVDGADVAQIAVLVQHL